jgi:hypothetical protein
VSTSTAELTAASLRALLGSMSPSMWGIGAPRFGQVIIYTFGRIIGGIGLGASRDRLDSLEILSAVETPDTYSHLWPDSDDRTRDAIDSVLGSTAYRPARDQLKTLVTEPRRASWPVSRILFAERL